MSSDVGDIANERTKVNAKQIRSKSTTDNRPWQWWRLPAPVKRIFDEFPLQTYSANELPQRTTSSRDKNTLYIFTTDESARSGGPSFNPGCLKWQTYLKFQATNFECTPSTNHASPTGALPFLLPAFSSSEPPMPVPSGRIQRWIRDGKPAKALKQNGHASSNTARAPQTDDERLQGNRYVNEKVDIRYDAYMSLIDHRIRNAYLYSLYLSPLNFDSVASVLYIEPTTTNHLVRIALRHQLRSAAEAELLKQMNVIDVQSLHRESEKAFTALSTLLGSKEYFFGEKQPSLFDASVFAYTDILLDDKLQWQIRHLQDALEKHVNLVNHRNRIRERYYGTNP